MQASALLRRTARPRDDHVFNDDLLTNEGDLDTAGTLYPRVMPILDHLALRDQFSVYNSEADAAKKRSRISGIFAILIGTISLLSAATTPLLSHCPSLVKWFGLVAFACGLLSIGIGVGGVLHARSKR